MSQHLKPGDEIDVFIPGDDDIPDETRTGIVKYAGVSVYYYCKDRCGECGPVLGDGAHAVNWSNSYIV